MTNESWYAVVDAARTLTQGDLIREKQSGTAQWILSGPVSRESFLLSNLKVNTL